MRVERGGKAIIASFVGAWFIGWAVFVLTEVSMIAFWIGAPLFLILLVAWVLQKPSQENSETDVPTESNTG